MPIPPEFGEVFTGYERKPEKAVAKLLKEKTGCCPGVFYHKEVGPIALAYGKTIEEDPQDKGGLDLAHMKKKHPDPWKDVEKTLSKGEVWRG